MEKQKTQKLLEYIKKGLRLNTPAPRIEKDPTKYTRKDKYKKDYKQENE